MTTSRLLLALLATAITTTAATPTATAAEPLKVLFIGNSLTFTNHLPETVAALAKAGGQRPLVVGSWTPGGRSFKDQWTDGKQRALAKIQSQSWDWVVLQGHSTETITAPQDTVTYGTLFNDAVAKQGARTLWYMTWAHRDHQDQQPRITSVYTGLATTTHGTLVPAGQAWDAVRTAEPTLPLYADIKHPNPTGTYLVACVFYATLFHTSPVGLPGEVTLDQVSSKSDGKPDDKPSDNAEEAKADQAVAEQAAKPVAKTKKSAIKLTPAQVRMLQEQAWAAVQAVPPALSATPASAAAK